KRGPLLHQQWACGWQIAPCASRSRRSAPALDRRYRPLAYTSGTSRPDVARSMAVLAAECPGEAAGVRERQSTIVVVRTGERDSLTESWIGTRKAPRLDSSL